MKKLLSFLLVVIAVVGFTAQAASDITLKEVNYNDGDTYDFFKVSGSVIFTYTKSVTVDNASIVLTDETKVGIITTHIMDYGMDCYYYCDISSQVKTLVEMGQLSVGDTIKVLLEGVKSKETSELIGDDGTASVDIVIPELPAQFVSVSKPEGSTIKSIYGSDDPEAKISFTFTAPVTCQESVLVYGSVEDETYGTMDFPVTYEGNNIIADLSGVNLNPEKINGATSVTMTLKGIKTANGSLVEGNIPGANGSVGVSYNVKKVVVTEVYGGFDTSDDIDKVDSITCFVNVPIKMKGVNLSYQLGGQDASILIPIKYISQNTDEDGVYFKVPVSNFSFDAGDVTAEIVGAETEDGFAVELENGVFTSAGRVLPNKCLFIDPTPGNLDATPEEYEICFNNPVEMDNESSNLTIAGEETPLSMLCQVTVDNNKIKLSDFRGQFGGEYTLNLKVKSGESYYTYGDVADMMTLIYNIKANTFNCVNVTPEGRVESLKDITLAFKGVDDYDEVGGFDSSKTINVINEEGNEVATGTIDFDNDVYTNAVLSLSNEITEKGVYYITIPEGTVYNSLFDDFLDDFGVSNGAKYNPEIKLTYIVGDIEATTCTVSPEEGSYDAIPKEIVITFSRDVTLEEAYMSIPQDIPNDILSKVTVNGNVAKILLTDEDIQGQDYWTFSFKFKDSIGEYVCYGDVPDMVSFSYEVMPAANTYQYDSVTPAEGEVTSLKDFKFSYFEFGGFDSSKEIKLINADTDEVVANGTVDYDAEDWDAADVTLDQEITAAGSYVLVIPEATIYDGLFDEFSDDFGVAWGATYNPEVRINYTITASGVESVLKDMTGKVNVYNMQGMKVAEGDDSSVVKTLIPGIYIINGTKVAIK